METIYLCIVIFLLCLAVFDLFVGVSNDAVNLLQSGRRRPRSHLPHGAHSCLRGCGAGSCAVIRNDGHCAPRHHDAGKVFPSRSDDRVPGCHGHGCHHPRRVQLTGHAHIDLFPSANATYKLDKKNQIRLSYGRSVNRPEFREVSPSVYYDFDLASNVEGNFNLKNCYVDNLDVSYEWYPSRDEMISFPKRSGDQRSDLRLRGCRNNHRPRAGELLQR